MDAAFFRGRLSLLRDKQGAPPAVVDELESALAWLVPDAGQTPPLRHVHGLSETAHALFIALLDEAIVAAPKHPASEAQTGHALTLAATGDDPVFAFALSEMAQAETEAQQETEPQVPETAPPDDAAFLAFEADRFRRRYDLVELVGHGTFGQVLRARDRYLQREVALKRLNLSSLRTAEDAARRLFRYSLLLEARVGAQLVHPNLVPIHDFGFDGEGNPYLVMRYLKGGATLREVLKKRSEGHEPVSREALIKVLIKVCDGLSFAHAHGVVHRDVKPENIYIADFDDVTVLDWGIARLLDKTGLDLAEFSTLLGEAPRGEEAQQHQQRSLFGGRVGTPAYMAPEQARAENSAVDGRTDVWALGVILYEVLTGTRPFGDSKQQNVLDRVLDGEFELPSRRVERLHAEARTRRETRRRDSHAASAEDASDERTWVAERVPAELDRIVSRALAYRNEDRYQSLVEMRRDLEAFLAHRPLEDASPWEVMHKWAGRNRVTVSAVTLLVLLLAVGLIVGVTRYVQDVTAERHEAAQQRAEAKRHAHTAQLEREAAQSSRDDAELMLADASLYRGRSLGSQGRWSQAQLSFAEAQRILTRRGHDDAAVATLGLWDVARHAPEPVQQFTLPGSVAPAALKLATDGWRLLVLDFAGEAHAFDVAQRTLLEAPQMTQDTLERDGWLVQPEPVIQRLQPGTFLVAAADGTTRLVTLNGEAPPVRLPGAEHGAVLATAVRPEQSELWLGTAGGSLVRYQWREGRVLQRIPQAHIGSVVALAWHEPSATLFSMGTDDTLAAWSLASLTRDGGDSEPQWRVDLPSPAAPGALALVEVAEGAAHPGLRVVAGTEEYAETFHAASGDEADTLYTLRTEVRAVAPAPEPGYVYVVTDGHLALLTLNRRTPRLLDDFVLPPGMACVRLEPEAGLLLAGFADGRVAAYSLGVRGGARVLAGHKAPVTALAGNHVPGSSTEADLLISGDAEGEVRVWDVLSGRNLHRYRHGGGERVVAAGFAADGRSAVTVAVNGIRNETTLRHYDLLAGADLERVTFEHAERPLLPVADGVSPDGRWVALHRSPQMIHGEAEPGLYLWRVGGSRVPLAVPRSVAVDAPGRTVAFAQGGRMLVQLDAQGQMLRRWRLTGEGIVALTPQPLAELQSDAPHWIRLDERRSRLYVGYRQLARLDVFTHDGVTWRRSAQLEGVLAEQLSDALVLESNSADYVLTSSGAESAAVLWQLDEQGGAAASKHVLATQPTVPHTFVSLSGSQGPNRFIAFGGDTGLIQLWRLDLEPTRSSTEDELDLLRLGGTYSAQGAWTLAHRCFEQARQRGDRPPLTVAARAAWLSHEPQLAAEALGRMSESEAGALAQRLLLATLGHSD